MQIYDNFGNESIKKIIYSSIDKYRYNTFINPIEDDMTPITYDELEKNIYGFYSFLEENRILPGERIAVLGHNSTAMALLFLAIIANERSFIPINPKSGAKEVSHILSISGVKQMLVDREYINLIKKSKYPVKVTYFKSSRNEVRDFFKYSNKPPLSNSILGGTESEIVFTSGSTGLPKGVVLTHKNLITNGISLASRYKISQDDNFLVSSPIFHNSGQIFSILSALFSGATITPVRAENALIQFWHLISKFDITWTLIMTDFLRVLLSRKEQPTKGVMKGILAGGSMTNKDLIERFESRFGINIYQVYGLTETTSISSCEIPNDKNRVTGSAGLPLDGCKIRIVKNGSEAAPGKEGEIFIYGDNVFKEYLGNNKLTNEKKNDGYLRTGDTGIKNKLGYLTVIDRIDNMIIIGGENVYPTEIETLVLKFDEIEQAFAVGIRDDKLGKKIILVYTLRNNKDKNIKSWIDKLKIHLSKFKIPSMFLSLKEIGLNDWPKSANQKVVRRKLAKLVENHLLKN